jgi:DNA-binding CsgD family transcriptional regulator
MVNGERIGGPTVARHGDTISFGGADCVAGGPGGSGPARSSTLIFETPEGEPGPHVSPRQRHVLELMAAGRTNAQIGGQLGISERTVKAYAQELYDKLGVRNRAGASPRAADAISPDLTPRERRMPSPTTAPRADLLAGRMQGALPRRRASEPVPPVGGPHRRCSRARVT